MHPAAKQVKNILGTISSSKNTFKTLRKHLDKQPVGYPRTLTGVEIKLLRAMFTVEHAKVALHMDYKHRTFDDILSRVNGSGITEDELAERLQAMEEKGSIYVKHKEGRPHYALHPFALGMYEFQLPRINPEFARSAYSYMLQGYLMEFLTSEPPQSRIIPIEKSITPELHVATYDQIREVIEATKDRISVGDCLCKTSQRIQGDPCKRTTRLEVCFALRDWSDIYVRHGWARQVSKTEALEILDRNEKEGHVLQPNCMQEPQFICSCCGCCCGMLKCLNSMPRPVDFTGCSFYAVLDREKCNGCMACLDRCQMDAITYNTKTKKASSINLKRCIGCGLCVPTCKKGALSLKEKQTPFVPPKDDETLYETIMQHKKGTVSKYYTYSKAMLGMKTIKRN